MTVLVHFIHQELVGFRSETWRQVFCIFAYIFSLGFLLLIFYWKPEWDVYCNCVSCDLEQADVILLRTTVSVLQQQVLQVVPKLHHNSLCVNVAKSNVLRLYSLQFEYLKVENTAV